MVGAVDVLGWKRVQKYYNEIKICFEVFQDCVQTEYDRDMSNIELLKELGYNCDVVCNIDSVK